MSGKNEEYTLTVTQVAKGFSAIVLLLITVVSWSMYEGIQASDIKANTTAIETNKMANDKEHISNSKTLEKLDTTVESLRTAVIKLNANIEANMAKKN